MPWKLSSLLHSVRAVFEQSWPRLLRRSRPLRSSPRSNRPPASASPLVFIAEDVHSLDRLTLKKWHIAGLFGILGGIALATWGFSYSIAQEVDQQNILIGVGLTRSMHSLNQLQREVLRLQFLLTADSPDRLPLSPTATPDFQAINHQRLLTQSRFEVLARQYISLEDQHLSPQQLLQEQENLAKMDQAQAQWKAIQGKIDRWQAQTNDLKLYHEILSDIQSLELLINETAQANQFLRLRAYNQSINHNQFALRYTSYAFILFCLFLVLSVLYIYYLMGERQKIFQDLLLSKASYQRIVETSQEAIFLLDQAHCLVLANQQSALLLGLDLGDLLNLVGTPLVTILECRNLENLWENLDQALTLAPKSLDYCLKQPNRPLIWLCINLTPILDAQGHTINTLVMMMDITDRKRSEQELQVLNTKLHRMATLDDLTQVANRRSFNQQLKILWERSAQIQTPISLILCDVDYFKYYNDHYGHQAGDDCLYQVAQVLVQAIRSQDFVARYGGEEFVLLLPDTTTEQAERIAERIQHMLETLALRHAKSLSKPWVTLSLGIACDVASSYTSARQLIQQADEALYRAKSEGRDRFCTYAALNLIGEQVTDIEGLEATQEDCTWIGRNERLGSRPIP